jgi:hypothetical protein
VVAWLCAATAGTSIIGRTAGFIHGIYWSGFQLFMQPTLWDTIRMAITGVALSFVAQHNTQEVLARHGRPQFWQFGFLSEPA